MAKVTIGHHPELTPEAAMGVFRKHFAEKYEVYKALIGKNFIVKKSGWTGFGVALKQQKDSTSFRFSWSPPSTFVWFLCAGLIPLLIVWVFLRPTLKAMEDEIKSFIENAPEFK